MKSSNVQLKSKVVFLALFFVMLSGCATKYSCGQFPDAQCSPVSATYDSTNDGYMDYRSDLFKEGDKDGVRRKSIEAEFSDISNASKRLAVAKSGDPVLTKPVYMRWLFSDWVDKEEHLHSGGYFYVKVKESQWITQ